jgi:hypothetical protein
MYEDLSFGEIATAHRTANGDVIDLEQTSIRHETGLHTDEALHIQFAHGDAPVYEIVVDLISGDITQPGNKPDYKFDDSNVGVSDGAMTITLDAHPVTVTIGIECEGEVTDDTGVDLDDLGIDL